MADEQVDPTLPSVGAFMRALEDLRDDVREDIGHLRDDQREDNRRLEERVMTAIHEVRREAVDFVVTHGREHEQMARQRDLDQSEFRTFVRNAELAQARRDGALGVFRFAVEQLSRHYRPLAVILGCLTGLLLAASGSVGIEILIR